MELTRAFSTITVKGIDEEHRIITGIATTPTPDRALDIVSPLGVTFKNPLPLLWQHDHLLPVGTANFDPPTSDGIRFSAQIAKIAEPGTLKDRVDEAWISVREKIISSVSIGFRVLDGAMEPIKNGGFRYLKTEVMELSLCTIPAQPDAKILTIRNADPAKKGTLTPRIMGNDKTIWQKLKGNMAPVPYSLLAVVCETLVAQIKKGFDKHATTLESLERRASRHATHLAGLEDRLKILEHK